LNFFIVNRLIAPTNQLEVDKKYAENSSKSTVVEEMIEASFAANLKAQYLNVE
jgi:hypothetical protein